MLDHKELTGIIGLLRDAPTTYGVAHNLNQAVTKLIALRDAVKSGSVLMLLEADEAKAVADGRNIVMASEPQPSGPQIPQGALESSQT